MAPKVAEETAEAQVIKAADSAEAAEAQLIKTAAGSEEAVEAEFIKAADKRFEQALVDLNVPQSTVDEDDEGELPVLLSEGDGRLVSEEVLLYLSQLANPSVDEEYLRQRAAYFRLLDNVDDDSAFKVTIDGMDQRKHTLPLKMLGTR